jgi:hypothetical protein
MDIETLKALMDARGMRQVDLVAALVSSRIKYQRYSTESANGSRMNFSRFWHISEITTTAASIRTPRNRGMKDYVDVPILPSFVGMGVVGLVMAI